MPHDVWSADHILEHRRFEETDQTVISAIFHSGPHFRGHTQEIVLMTRMQLGDSDKFLSDARNGS